MNQHKGDTMTPEQFVDLLDTTVERDYYDNGQLLFERYWIDGKLHRLDGPAIRCWGGNGELGSEHYYINGKLHRLNGPACRCWYSNGQLWYEEYWIDDKELNKEEFENDPRTIR